MKHGLRRWVWEYKMDLLLLSVCIVPLLLYLKRTYLGGVDCLWQWHYRSWFDLGLPLRLQSGKFKWMDVSGTRIHQDWHLIGCDTCQTSKCGPKHTILALIPFWWILTGGRILALENQSWCEKHGIGQFGTLSMKFYAVGDFCAASIWWPLPVLHLHELVHRLQLQPSYWLFEQIISPKIK